MPSTRKFLSFFLLFAFTLNGFSIFRENFISGGVFNSDGSSLLGAKFRAAIGATKFIPSCFKPLTLFTALDETCLVNLTTQSLDVKIIDPKTVASVTGGIFGDVIFQVNNFVFYWQNSLCNQTHNLEAQVYLFNWKYGSFLKAMENPDGIAVMNFPISTTGDISNWKFGAFSKIIVNKIKAPGDYIKIRSASTYTWFVDFSYGSIYHTYKKKFTDPSSGKKYTATVIDLPLDPRVNFISKNQFLSTFGRIKKIREDEMAKAFIQDSSITSKERRKGICVLNLPA